MGLKPSGITVGESNEAKMFCPHCNSIIEFDISMFKNKTSQILCSHCPLCNGKVFAAVIILASKELRDLTNSIIACQNALPNHKTILGGKPQ